MPIALTISVLFRNRSLVVLLADRLSSLPAEKGVQRMGETRSFYSIGSSEGWVSTEVRVSNSVSGPVLCFPSASCGLFAPCMHK